MKIAEIVNELRKTFLEFGNVTRAQQMKAYVRNQYNFFGVEAKNRRRIAALTLQICKLTSEEEEKENMAANRDVSVSVQEIEEEEEGGEKKITPQLWLNENPNMLLSLCS